MVASKPPAPGPCRLCFAAQLPHNPAHLPPLRRFTFCTGVDDFDSYPELAHFIRTVAEGSAVRHFIIHARKCLLKGLNPHQNRTVRLCGAVGRNWGAADGSACRTMLP